LAPSQKSLLITALGDAGYTAELLQRPDVISLYAGTQQQGDARDQRRHSSVSDASLDSNVLRKVASLTLDKATIEQRVSRPKFVPEKLDFQIYEKFEGKSLYEILIF
jgi:formin 2